MSAYAKAFTAGFQRGQPSERADNPAYQVHQHQQTRQTQRGLRAPVPQFLQGVATLKHFDANSLEGDSKSEGSINRHTVDVQIDNFTLADAYFPAFRAAIEATDARGVMCRCAIVRLCFTSCCTLLLPFRG